MAPAFSSLREAGAFVLLLLIVLASPLLIPKSALPPREQIYAALPWEVGPFPFLDEQIFKEKSDIDIAIVGSSRLWAALDSTYLQEKLSEKLGRKAVVVTIGWPWTGFDALYRISRDLLEHRKVHMLVFADESGLYGVVETPHEQSWRWLRYSEESDGMAGLSLRIRLANYYGTIMSMPRTIMAMLRPALPPVMTPEKFQSLEALHEWIMPQTRGGALTLTSEGADTLHPKAREPFTPGWSASPTAFVTYSPETVSEFKFEKNSLDSVQVYYARKFAEVAKAHDARLVCLNLPGLGNRRSMVMTESYFWPDVLQAHVTLVGIPPGLLFAGIPDQDVMKLYWDRNHLNLNGENYFTPLVAPKLFQIYDEPENY